MRDGGVGAPVLVLNQNYAPLNVCNVRRAIVLVGRGKAELLVNGRGEVRTPRTSLLAPSVIRLMYLVRRPVVQRRLARRDVFARDRYTCQYCGRATRELTLDHVIPRHRGGAHSWENIVAACIPCNHRKAGRTPKEAGMRLLRGPRAPRPNPYYLFHARSLEEDWLPFMPWAAP
ncbi:MAG: HNH endonuclease [Chloroflexi bacterium]|nr:HNH endonuclease [Chloroflexota bacterium]